MQTAINILAFVTGIIVVVALLLAFDWARTHKRVTTQGNRGNHMSKLSHSNQEMMDQIERDAENQPDGPIEQRTQWFKAGDHPAVRRPTEAHLQPSPGLKNCGVVVTAKGEELIREGDWIVQDESGIRIETGELPQR